MGQECAVRGCNRYGGVIGRSGAGMRQAALGAALWEYDKSVSFSVECEALFCVKGAE